jgi:acetoin utilization deacetylase AcuC-like enzyme
MRSKTTPVFYCAAMNADGNNYSPSAAKPGIVAAALVRAGIPVRFIEPVPLTDKQIALAHDLRYVRGVLSGLFANGFGNHSLDVARSLPFTNGAIVDAALMSLDKKVHSAALVSGFHHAEYACGMGFCTFNGLVIAAIRCLESGARRVAIIDADMHWGNGTQHILDRLNLNDLIFHYSFGHDYYSPKHARAYLKRIDTLWLELESFQPDAIIYQAGADAHKNDPLGGVLNTGELMERDRRIFGLANKLGIGVAWTLAGGYQMDKDGGISKVVEIHLNTFRAAMRVRQ